MIRRALIALLFVAFGARAEPPEIVVGSKTFPESEILAESAAHLAEDAGAAVRRRLGLGGSGVLFSALQTGDIDVYPEYTGTLMRELLADRNLTTLEGLRATLDELGVAMSDPIGFNNTYVIGMRRSDAERLGVRTVSDLRDHPDLRVRFSQEFMDRSDGWPSLRARYALPHTDVGGMKHAMAYLSLANGQVDVIDLYATDAEIALYDLATLEDDLGHFPRYDAVLLWRKDLAERAPEVIGSLRRMEGALDERAMTDLNLAVREDRESPRSVAAGFVNSAFGINAGAETGSVWSRIVRLTLEHLFLVSVSMALAVVAAVPLGVAAAKLPRLGRLVLGAVGVVQTIPSLALLVFMIPLLGLSPWSAILALFLYSLLPIVRNTHAGLSDIPTPIRESAEALGLASSERLVLVELPLASRAILAGVKTAVVINIGTATLGALIDAGGYGKPIFTGIDRVDMRLILMGAVPAALMALAAQLAFDALDRVLIPRGLRGTSGT